MRKSRTVLIPVAVLLLATGLTAVAAAPRAEAAPRSATATLTQSGCELTLAYTWNNFNNANGFVTAIQQVDVGAVTSRGMLGTGSSGSETLTYSVPAGTTSTFQAQAWLYKNNAGTPINDSKVTTPTQTVSCP